jgi:hypothetical protein
MPDEEEEEQGGEEGEARGEDAPKVRLACGLHRMRLLPC